MYEIALTPYAAKALEKLRLSRVQKNLIVRAIDSLASNPERGTPLRRELRGFHKLRVGDFRIVYEIKREKLLVVVVGIGNRKNIYETLARRASLI